MGNLARAWELAFEQAIQRGASYTDAVSHANEAVKGLYEE